jgi:hypothetical protein
LGKRDEKDEIWEQLLSLGEDDFILLMLEEVSAEMLSVLGSKKVL